MSEILVRNLDAGVVRTLKDRAKHNRRSLQAEVKTILEDVATRERWRKEDVIAVAERMQKKLARRHTVSDSVEMIREDRER